MLLLEIAELLSHLQFTNSQLQELFVALTDIATTKPTRQSPDETFDVINTDDVSQDVSSEGSSDKDTHGTSCSPTTTAPSAIAAEPDAPSTVTTVPVTPTGTAVVAAPDAPSTVITGPPSPASAAVIAAPAATATTRVFNGVSYQYPANSASSPFYLVTRSCDIGVFVGWFIFFSVDSFCVVDFESSGKIHLPLSLASPLRSPSVFLLQRRVE